MDPSIWTKLDDIQTALSKSIGVLLPLADGLDGYSSRSDALFGALSGAHAAAYADTLFSAYHTLSGITREFGETLERTRAGTGAGGEEPMGFSRAPGAGEPPRPGRG